MAGIPPTPSVISRSLLPALCALTLAACANGPEPAPQGTLHVRGPVEAIAHRATASGIAVAGGPDSPEPCGILATADVSTRYWQRTAEGTLVPLPLASLTVGDTVEVYVTGPVAESCPTQGRAAAVVRVAP
jgi:hypothetical protein